MKEKFSINNPIKQILDEDNYDNIILLDAQNKPIEFEQVAVIPLEDDSLFAILIPVTPMQGVEEGEAVLFQIDEEKNDIQVCNDEQTIEKVYEIYEKLLKENEENGKEGK